MRVRINVSLDEETVRLVDRVAGRGNRSAFIEDAVQATLRRNDVSGTWVHGKDVLPLAGEYTNEVVLTGVARFLEAAAPRGLDVAGIPEIHRRLASAKASRAAASICASFGSGI